MFEFHAVITAGGRIDGAFEHEAGTPVKALAPMRGRPLGAYAVEAAWAAGASGVALVADPGVHECIADARVRCIVAGASGHENLRRALRAWPGARRIVYLTSDLPFIDGMVLRAFLDRVDEETLALPLVSASAFEQRFPAAPPFGITLAGERVVNGGAFVIPGSAVARIETVAGALFEARKHPVAMARITGFSLLLRMLFGRLSVADLERRAAQVLGICACAVRDASPELAYDVDTLEEYRYAKRA